MKLTVKSKRSCRPDKSLPHDTFSVSNVLVEPFFLSLRKRDRSCATNKRPGVGRNDLVRESLSIPDERYFTARSQEAFCENWRFWKKRQLW